MKPSYDVIVAGAGPGGVAMAAALTRLDRFPRQRILVLERHRFPRDKPCGGGLTGHAEAAMTALDLAVEVPSWVAPRAQVRFGGFQRTVDLDHPIRVIRREEFDASLVDQIRRRGIEVVEDEGLVGYDVEASRVTVTTTRGRRLTAEVLVGADGAGSLVRKKLGGTRELPHRLFRFELPLPPDRVAELTAALVYDFTPMTLGLRGYLWLFPMAGDRLNVGVMHYPTTRISGRELVEILRRGLAAHGLELPPRGTRGWPVWGYEPSRAIAGPRVVTIGDAAGVDALTGEGIAVAMEQAIFAAGAIANGFDRGDLSFSRYRKQLRHATVGRELTLDRRLSRLLYRSPKWQRWLSLVLYDPEVLGMYAARVAGSRILADQKLHLFHRLFVHALRLRARRRALDGAAAAAPLALLAPPDPEVAAENCPTD